MSCCIPPKDSDPELRSFFIREIIRVFHTTDTTFLESLTLEGLRKIHTNRHSIKHTLDEINGA